MKLRNKKTWEIREIKNILLDGMFTVNSLAELNEEWEDYEEPKELERYSVDTFGNILPTNDVTNFSLWKLRQIGNYFEAEEEAEKAVEKLKAWKRLKDCGFKFVGWKRDERYSGDYHIEAEDYDKCDDKDLDLLFGGEE